MEWWIWLVAAAVLLVVEMLTPGGFYFLFFGAGALAAGLYAVAGGANLVTQSVIFLGASIAAILFFRKPLLARFQSKGRGKAVDSLIGETATLSEPLRPGDFGQAELRGATWKVRNIGGAPIPSGQRCIVEQIDGLTLNVRAAD